MLEEPTNISTSHTLSSTDTYYCWTVL